MTQDRVLLSAALSRSRTLRRSAKESILRNFAVAQRTGVRSRQTSLARLSALTNAMLASDFSHNMETWLTKAFNEGVASAYDRSADALYAATRIGGGQLHRLFDGRHTVVGMWEAVREAKPDDDLLQEVVGFATAYGKDLSSHVGMPLFTMSKQSYDQVADVLRNSFHIPKPWLQDLFHVNGVEVMGSSVAALVVGLRWTKAETEEFSKLAGSLGISSIVSANPALALITLATLAQGFMKAKKKGDFDEAVDGLAKGGFGTGVFLASSAAIGGPVWIGIMTGMCTAAVAQRATNSLNVHEVSDFVRRSVGSQIGLRTRIRGGRHSAGIPVIRLSAIVSLTLLGYLVYKLSLARRSRVPQSRRRCESIRT